MKVMWMNLVFPIKENKVLLAKKTKKIGVGKWNGWGGKVENNESIRDSAVRELFQESGLMAKPQNLEKVAMCTFINTTESGEEIIVKVVVFLIREWEAELSVNDEMKEPTWFPIDKLPDSNEFMPADPYWLSHVISGKRLTCVAKYTPNQESLVGEPEVQFLEVI